MTDDYKELVTIIKQGKSNGNYMLLGRVIIIN